MKIKGVQPNDVLEGFGARHTAKQWAELLGIPFRILHYYIESEGLTVEAIYARYGYVYQAPEPKGRKPRMGAQMLKTQQRMYELLLISGYIGPDDGLDDVQVRAMGTNPQHLVVFKDHKMGVYNYTTGGLRLNSGEGLPLWKLEWEDVKIRRNAMGMWEAHPDTRALMAQELGKKAQGEIQQAEYDRLIDKYKTTPAAERWEKYEGFGESHTVPEWARILGVSRRTLLRYVTKGWTIEEYAEKNHLKYK